MITLRDIFDDLADQAMMARGNRAQLAALFRNSTNARIQEAADVVNESSVRLNDAINSAQTKEIHFLAESVIQLSARLALLEK